MSDSGGEYAPILQVSADNQSGVIILYVVIGSILSILITALRLCLAFYGRVNLGADDFLLFVCLVFSLAQSATVALSAKVGLGRHRVQVSEQEIELVYKYIYASGILTVLSLGLAKSSVIELYNRISVYETSKRISWALQAMVMVWILFCALSIALNCSLPRPWDFLGDKCVGVWSFYVTNVITNIITDLIIVLHVIPGVWKLTMTKKLRFGIILLFSSRLLVCIPSLIRLGLSKGRKENINNITWDFVPFAILESVEVHISIITANIPRVQAFFLSLATGKSVGRVSGTEEDQSSNYATIEARTADQDMIFDGSTIVPDRPLPGTITRYPLRLVPTHGATLKTNIYSNNSRPSSSDSRLGSVAGTIKFALGRFTTGNTPRMSSCSTNRTQLGHNSDIVVDIEIQRRESYNQNVEEFLNMTFKSPRDNNEPDYIEPPKAPTAGYRPPKAMRRRDLDAEKT